MKMTDSQLEAMVKKEVDKAIKKLNIRTEATLDDQLKFWLGFIDEAALKEHRADSAYNRKLAAILLRIGVANYINTYKVLRRLETVTIGNCVF